MSFDQLGLRPEYVRAVADEGYTEPTPVQSEAIPLVLAGRDLLAGAQTGTGKTAAFVLPILQRLNATRRPGPRPIRTLILVPTRELALQVTESVRVYGAHQQARGVAIYGGVGFDRQVRDLRSGPEIVVATPGRLLDHLGQRTIDLRSVEILVLDEADRMLDMGFIHDVRKILAVLPAARQSLLFSATFSPEIRSLAGGMLHDPATVQVTPRNTAPELVAQLVMPVDRERKRELLTHLVRSRRIDQALVFTRTKHGANRLAEQLDKDGIAAAAIHGNKSQPQRVRALDDFKQGRILVLVATDIAARGIDIDALPHVVNYELPTVPEDYVHRIGRTGRAGVDGIAISLVCVDENKLLRDIEQLLKRRLDREVVPGFEPDPNQRAEPIKFRSAMGRPPMLRQSAPRQAGNAFRPRGNAARTGGSVALPGGHAPRQGENMARPISNALRPISNVARHNGEVPRPSGNAPRPMGNGPRPAQRPVAANAPSIGNRGPAPTNQQRDATRRPRPANWRTSPHPTSDRPSR